MPIDQQTTGVAGPSAAAGRCGVVIAKVLVLLGLTAWAFWPQLDRCVAGMTSSGDWAHGLIAPVLIVLLIFRRRSELSAALTRGSVWGALLLLLGFGLLAVSIWPCSYGYPRDVALVPVSAGIVLAMCGWRVLKLCLPMLLVLFLGVPMGPRQHATLIIRPETYTLSATHAVLRQLPGVGVRRAGVDLDFRSGSRSGTVALGEPRRGASLLATYIVIGVFVVFARIRPFWQVALLALAAVPIALLCNFLRILCWGLIAVLVGPDPVSPWPRAVAATFSLVLAYVLFALACWTLSHIIVESEVDDDAASQCAVAEA